MEHTDLSIVLDIQYLTLLERILWYNSCRNAPGSYCRDCVDAGCRVECCFCRAELLEACLYCMALECCKEPYSWSLPCGVLGDTGNSCWKEPARDEPCSCSISWRRINSVCRITWSCCIACGNTVVLVECGNTTVLEDRLKNLSLDLLSPLLWK